MNACGLLGSGDIGLDVTGLVIGKVGCWSGSSVEILLHAGLIEASIESSRIITNRDDTLLVAWCIGAYIRF